jgi:peptidoglycan-N-acetylglucosamine deacetylase
MPIRRLWRAGPAAALVAMLVGSTTLVVAAPAGSTEPAESRQAARCSRGLVALTFDDGPQPGTTRAAMRILARHRAPATFFMVGERISGHGRLLRRLRHHGFQVANHTFGHENLTRLSSGRVRSTLRRTNRAIRHAGLGRTRLARPPYGAIDHRVRRIIRGLGMTPVLWDVDSRDWDGRSARRIVSSVMSQLDRGPNIVLLHDGVANSDRTVAALPRLIRKIRRHGYCLAGLNRHGQPTPPVPRLRASGDTVRERSRGKPAYLRFEVRLSKATSRPVSVRVRTRQASALAGRDFQARRFRLRFPVGVTQRTVRVRVYGNARAEPNERLRLVFSHPRGVRVATGFVRGTIRDDD